MSDSVDIQLDRAIQERIATAQEARLRSDGQGAFSVSFTFGTKAAPIDFGASLTQVIAPPAGLRGEIKSIDVYDCSETFNKDTGDGAVILVGTAADTNKYGTSAVLGTLASGAGTNLAVTDGVTTVLPADADILVSFIQSDHGTPAGKAVVTLTINFFV